jgi:pyrroloquinoline quinone (PQQ) biosynthesis protein C
MALNEYPGAVAETIAPIGSNNPDPDAALTESLDRFYGIAMNDPWIYRMDDLPSWISGYFNSDSATCRRLNNDYSIRKALAESTHALASRAYREGDAAALDAATAVLEVIYRHDFALRDLRCADCEVAPIARDMAAILEENYLSCYLKAPGAQDIASPPTDGKEYVRWFKDIIQAHCSSNHQFYEHFLPDIADREHIRFYLAQETNLDPRFDDILAQIQIGHHGVPKMEIAQNYWDEMGNGDSGAVHTSLFQKTLTYLGVDAKYLRANVFAQSIASGNMSACLALYRRHNLRALGYFGTTEYIAPKRFKSLLKAWERNGLDPVFAEYHRLHVSIDAVHGNAWLNNVIAPLVDNNPLAARQVAEGMLLRLSSSSDYLDALLARVTQS